MKSILGAVAVVNGVVKAAANGKDIIENIHVLVANKVVDGIVTMA